ncbi:4Fe-4S dicluster domain-containing protein [Vibrio sp. SCSIO 43137]|uniref:4Fe-4S dicluster domain-containing protein n=1 Tax=Vibrio sp. SCSIO 43137 TaxID=3021011 RepID=UPI00230789AD|nr:4Fe-4S dicluster domain-containing protein [Vibrio sp. SCSIO 43137]WCE28597.1 SLBB domain-containing protein [Vibrio sp. SCSIO 43137]
MSSLLDKVKSAGVVGAGGAGFPTYVKLDCNVDLVLANGAECEPLLNKDQVVMQLWADEMLGGMLLAMKQTGATKAIIGIKDKHQDTIEIVEKAIEKLANPQDFSVLQMRDVYPAGDEVELIYEATGKRVPSGGLPKDIGVLVQNSESYINIFRAATEQPVTHTMVTVHGEVKKPYTAWLPVGISVADTLELAGGVTCDDYVIIDGGPMMGGVVESVDEPITRLSSGFIVIPASSSLAIKKTRPEKEYRRIGKAACDQCSLCTSMCPRHMLGYPIKPHLVMRALQTSGPNSETYALSAQACSECNLCSMWSCPEGLDPRNMCVTTKRDLRESGNLMTPEQLQAKTIDVHPMRDYRGVPTKRLMQRLGLLQYSKTEAKNLEREFEFSQVTIPLRQHIGAPAAPAVKEGDEVTVGQVIGQAPADALSVNIHASIAGKVASVTDQHIVIKK